MNASDSNGRTCAMFAAFYNNLDAIEILAASDAVFQQIDNFGRTCLHYACMTDNSKIIETIFMECKTNPQEARLAPEKSVESNEERKFEGDVDERYEDMEHQMVLIDQLPGSSQSPLE